MPLNLLSILGHGGTDMIENFEEQIIREKAVWFAKGNLREILKISIPEDSFGSNKKFIIAIIEVDKPVKKDLIDEASVPF